MTAIVDASKSQLADNDDGSGAEDEMIGNNNDVGHFEKQLGHQMACHRRQKTNALHELDRKIEGAIEELESASARLTELQAERNVFENTWNETWQGRHKNFTTHFLERRARDGELPDEVV